MKALMRQNKQLILTDIEEENQLSGNQLLIKVDKVGICRTDIYVAEGKIKVNENRVLGHEFSGYVLKKGENVSFEVNELVAINPLIACQKCENCLSNKSYLCANAKLMGLDIDGCLQEEIIVEEEQVLKINQHIDTRLVAYIEPVAAALSIFNAGILQSEQGVILGNNRFTKLLSLILKHKGFDKVDVIKNVNFLATNYADYVLETGISQHDFQEVLNKIKTQGKIIIRSRNYESLSFSPKELIAKEIQLKGVNYGPFEEAVKLVEEIQDDLLFLMGKYYPLSDYQQAFEMAKKEDDVKYFIQV